MSRESENTTFCCLHCNAAVLPLLNGSYRNHCPECLWSLHVDLRPGDRASPCRAPMQPDSVGQHPKKGYVLVHVCLECGHRQRCKSALDDPRQPDRIEVMITLIGRF